MEAVIVLVVLVAFVAGSVAFGRLVLAPIIGWFGQRSKRVQLEVAAIEADGWQRAADDVRRRRYGRS